MYKSQNPQWFKILKKGAIIAFVGEGLCFAGAYLFWYKLNVSRDFRYYCHVNYPTVLDGYYKVGEYFDPENVERGKRLDLAAWYDLPPPKK